MYIHWLKTDAISASVHSRGIHDPYLNLNSYSAELLDDKALSREQYLEVQSTDGILLMLKHSL